MRTKHIILSFIFLMLLLHGLPNSAQQLTTGNIRIMNKEVKKVGNNVNVNMDILLNHLKLKSNKGMVIIPMMVNQEDTFKMPAIEIMGRKRYLYYQRNHQTATPSPWSVIRNKSKEAQTLHYVYSTPFRHWMVNSQFVIGQDACGCQQAIVGENLLTQLGEALPGPMKLQYAYVQPQAEPIKARQEKGTARLNFNINQAIINTNLDNNRAELDKMRKTIDLVKNDADVHITSITLHGYASPDGSYANNEKLANNRTKAVYDYLRNLYPVEKRMFQFSSTAEDWQGVRDYVAKNEIPQKNHVMNIINSEMNPDEKERMIAAKAGEAHRYLIAKVYPQLRRTEYTVRYEVRDFNLEEARKVIKTRPQKLSLKEMYTVANSYEKGSQEYNDVFDIAVRMFPEDELANLNAAYTAIDRGDQVNAEKYLKKAGNRPEADNARGALAILKNDYNTAKTYFEKAASHGLKEAKENLKELRKRMYK